MYSDTSQENPHERMRVRLAAEGYKAFQNGGDEEEADEDAPSRGARKWTRLEKLLLLLVVICICIVLFLAIFLVVQHFVPFQTPTCQSLDCVEVAGSVIAAMNWSVDPCHDFYQFSCGNWLHTTVAPPSEAKWSQFSIVSERNNAIVKRLLDEPGDEYLSKHSTAVAKAKQFFRACMNTTHIESRGIQPALEYINRLGSWTVTSDSASGVWDAETWDLMHSMVAVFPFASPFFGMGVDIDQRNNTNYEIAFDQSGLLFGDPTFYVGNSSDRYRVVEVQLFTAIAELLGSTADTEEIANDIWNLEHRLAQIMTSAEDRVDPSATYNPMTLEELQSLTGTWLDLSAYLAAIFGREIPLSERVMVYDPAYLSKIGEVVRNTSRETLANYLVWTALPQLWMVLPQGFHEAQRMYGQALLGIDTLKEQWKSCVIATDLALPYATGGMFVNSVFSAEQRQRVDHILTTIQEQFYARLPKSNWMDETTKRNAMDKVRALRRRIAYPNITQSPALLDKHYHNVTTTDDAFQNYININQYRCDEMLAKLGSPVDLSIWGMSAMEVNAYYDPLFNEMVFPAGILQRVFYDPVYPMAMNYGALGMVMGHELTHGFDNTGRHFDKFGNMVDWWTNQSSAAFQDRAQCLQDQYSSYQIGEDRHINGLTTLGENIADNGGLKTAYYAYRNWLKANDYHETRSYLPGLNMTENQLFFVSFAQVWCVYETEEYMEQALTTDVHTYGPYRVRGVLSNMDEFSDAFSCAPNTPMNPTHKCSVW